MSDFDDFYIYDGGEDFCRGDSIEFYEDEILKEWWERFHSVSSDVIISDVPFSYFEIRRELIRRDELKG